MAVCDPPAVSQGRTAPLRNQRHIDVLISFGCIGLLPRWETVYHEPDWQGQLVFTAIPAYDRRSDVPLIPLQKETAASKQITGQKRHTSGHSRIPALYPDPVAGFSPG